MSARRWLHPGAWWLWALGLASAASRTTNPLLLLMLIAVAAVVVNARKPDAPWARSFSLFVRLGIAVVIVRVLVQVLFGPSSGDTLLLPMPGLTLPTWLAGVRLGGDLTLEPFLTALYDGLRLATILICIGAANSLASPTRLLKSAPAALYEFGVSVVVAMTFTPQLVADVDRLRTTRRLRGRPTSGPKAVASSAVPVLEGALERSVWLAAAMDSRGYGRRGSAPKARRRTASTLLLAGLVAACIGAYGLLSADAPAALGLPMLIAGVAIAAAGAASAGRATVRSRYRPDPWRTPEWLVSAAGIICAAIFAGAAWSGLAAMTTSTSPAQWPQLALLPLLGIAIAVTPAFTAPGLPANATRSVEERPSPTQPTIEVAA